MSKRNCSEPAKEVENGIPIKTEIVIDEITFSQSFIDFKPLYVANISARIVTGGYANHIFVQSGGIGTEDAVTNCWNEIKDEYGSMPLNLQKSSANVEHFKNCFK